MSVFCEGKNIGKVSKGWFLLDNQLTADVLHDKEFISKSVEIPIFRLIAMLV
jgi:hypothetical protein